MTFSVTTNNVTGYMLSISARTGTDLTNSAAGTSFTSLSTADGITSATFDTVTYNNQWGFKPNYYKTAANTDKFYPSPTTSGVTLNKTESANTNADNYTIAIGARATYSQPAGTYSNTYILSAVGNYPKYSITYADNSGDSTLTNMPSPNPQATPPATSTAVALSSATPTRTGYTFQGWCTADNSADTSACSGTTYAAGADYPLSTLSVNGVTLYATWAINKYNITITTDGHISGLTVKDSSANTISPSSTGTNAYVYGLTYGQTYTITPKPAANYDISSTTKASGAGTLSDYSFTVGAGVATISIVTKAITCNPSGTTISAISCMQDLGDSNYASVLSSMTENQQYQLYDNRDNKKYYVAKVQTDAAAPGGVTEESGKYYQIWMTQNLDLCIGCSASSNSTGIATAALTSENTDLHTYNSGIYTSSTGYSYSNNIITWTPASTAITSSYTISGTTVSPAFDNSSTGYNAPYSAEGGDTYVITSGNTNNDTATDNCTAGDTVCPHYHRGNYYNWSAAVASNNTSSLTTNYIKANNSICPAGWTLPYGLTASAGYSDFNYLLKQQGTITSLVSAGSNATWATNGFMNIRTNPLYFVRAGYVGGGWFNDSGTDGGYWSGTVYGSYDSYNLVLNSSRARPAHYIGRLNGWPLRCLARTPTTEITFTVKNTTYTAMNGMTWAQWIESDYAKNQGFSVYGDNVIQNYCINWLVRNQDESAVLPSDKIINGGSYTYSAGTCVS